MCVSVNLATLATIKDTKVAHNKTYCIKFVHRFVCVYECIHVCECTYVCVNDAYTHLVYCLEND